MDEDVMDEGVMDEGVMDEDVMDEDVVLWHDTFSTISVNCCYLCMHLLSPTLYVRLSCLSSYTIDVWLTLHYSIFSYM